MRIESVKRFLRDGSGLETVEWAFILGFVVLAAVLALMGAQESLSTIFTEMTIALGTAASGVPKARLSIETDIPKKIRVNEAFELGILMSIIDDKRNELIPELSELSPQVSLNLAGADVRPVGFQPIEGGEARWSVFPKAVGTHQGVITTQFDNSRLDIEGPHAHSFEIVVKRQFQVTAKFLFVAIFGGITVVSTAAISTVKLIKIISPFIYARKAIKKSNIIFPGKND